MFSELCRNPLVFCLFKSFELPYWFDITTSLFSDRNKLVFGKFGNNLLNINSLLMSYTYIELSKDKYFNKNIQ